MIQSNPDIKNLARFTGRTLNIIQPSIWKNNFEIKYNDEILGTISKHGWFGTDLSVKFFDNEWEIYRPGFWSSEIAIREKGRENPSASYKRKFFSREGFVSLPKGKKLKITFGAFRSSYAVYNMSGKCLVSFKDKISFKSKSSVKIEESSEILEEHPWVIVLAWNLAQQSRKSRGAG